MNMEEVYAIRFDRLQQVLWGEQFKGKQAALAAAVGKPANYISRILNGSKKLGEELVREFEVSLGMPPYWFDQRERRDQWPFPTVSSEKFASLTEDQKKGIEQWVARQVEAYATDIDPKRAASEKAA